MGKKHESKTRVPAFPATALTYLRKAGWMPSRLVPTALYEEAYTAEGLSLLPKVKMFLSRFGGLIISHVTKSQQHDVLEFLAERAVRSMGNGGIEGFEELIGVTPLCPIGHCSFGTCILLMDRRGQVFGGSDETVTFVATTGEEAISNILSGVESQILEPRISSAG
jgi:hypothetical protein